MKEDLLYREIFDTIHEARVFIEKWRRNYNTIISHSVLECRLPAPLYQFKNSLGTNLVRNWTKDLGKSIKNSKN